MRTGSLNQSTVTRSFGKACLMTQALPADRVTKTVRLDIPPASGLIISASSGLTRCVRRK